MDKTQKENNVDSLRKALSEVNALFLADFRGLTVEQVDGLRRGFKASGCVYKVVKNTLLRLAVSGTTLEPLSDMLTGPTAIAFSDKDPLEVAKVLVKFAKDYEKLEIKGGFFEGVRTASEVEALSKMPGKDELRSMLLATMLAVPQKLLRTLNAASQRFLLVLNARERKLS